MYIFVKKKKEVYFPTPHTIENHKETMSGDLLFEMADRRDTRTTCWKKKKRKNAKGTSFTIAQNKMPLPQPLLLLSLLYSKTYFFPPSSCLLEVCNIFLLLWFAENGTISVLAGIWWQPMLSTNQILLVVFSAHKETIRWHGGFSCGWIFLWGYFTKWIRIFFGFIKYRK